MRTHQSCKWQAQPRAGVIDYEKIASEEKYADIKPWVKTPVVQAKKTANCKIRCGKANPARTKSPQSNRSAFRFLRKLGIGDPEVKSLAERLQSCHPRRRCVSGACPQCGRLLQRWFVRTSKGFIADYLETAEGRANCHQHCPIWVDNCSRPTTIRVHRKFSGRRMKYALDKAKVEVGIGGLRFLIQRRSKGKVPTVLEPTPLRDHNNTEQKTAEEEVGKAAPKDGRLPHGRSKLRHFRTHVRRRSYALKTYFVVGLATTRRRSVETGSGNAENAGRNKLRAQERLRLLAQHRPRFPAQRRHRLHD